MGLHDDSAGELISLTIPPEAQEASVSSPFQHDERLESFFTLLFVCFVCFIYLYLISFRLSISHLDVPDLGKLQPQSGMCLTGTEPPQ